MSPAARRRPPRLSLLAAGVMLLAVGLAIALPTEHRATVWVPLDVRDEAALPAADADMRLRRLQRQLDWTVRKVPTPARLGVFSRHNLAAWCRALDVYPELTRAGVSTSRLVRTMARQIRLRPVIGDAPAGLGPDSALTGFFIGFEHRDPATARRVAARLADEAAAFVLAAADEAGRPAARRGAASSGDRTMTEAAVRTPRLALLLVAVLAGLLAGLAGRGPRRA